MRSPAAGAQFNAHGRKGRSLLHGNLVRKISVTIEGRSYRWNWAGGHSQILAGSAGSAHTRLILLHSPLKLRLQKKKKKNRRARAHNTHVVCSGSHLKDAASCHEARLQSGPPRAETGVGLGSCRDDLLCASSQLCLRRRSGLWQKEAAAAMWWGRCTEDAPGGEVRPPASDHSTAARQGTI